MFKRILCILLCILMLALVAGCEIGIGKEATDEGEDPTQVSETSATDSKNTSSQGKQPANTATVPATEQFVQTKLITTFEPLCQHPELPTGCEMTSLTMLLNYYGYMVDKCEISDKYLEKGEVGKVDPRKAFAGEPKDGGSFGCYAPVVVNTANKYLAENGSNKTAIDITNTEFEDLFSYVNADIPVIVWSTLDCQEGKYTVTWNVDGEDFTWFSPEHCLVLVGYEENMVWVADPTYGDIRSYDKEIFKSRYNSLYKQAVIIQ